MVMMSDSLQRAVDAVDRGKPIILVDSPDRENEGDLVLAAQHANADNLRFLLTYSTRMLCIPLYQERLEFLGLQRAVPQPTKRESCCFYTSVDPRHGNTGLGLEDKLLVIDALLNDEVPLSSATSRLAIPGHSFPLRAHPGGVLARQGHTEGSIALTLFANLYPGAVIAEVWDERIAGPMKGPSIRAFAQEFQLPVATIEDVVAYQRSLL